MIPRMVDLPQNSGPGWFFQPLAKTAPSKIDSSWVRGDIDRFILEKQREIWVEPAPELAYRMQAEAPETVELSKETDAIRRLYGMNRGERVVFGRDCILAPRLGLYAVEDRLRVHDLHATILHLLGVDHTKLPYS